MEGILVKLNRDALGLYLTFLPSGTWIRLLESNILKRNEGRRSQCPELFIYLLKHCSPLSAVMVRFIP